MQRRNQNGLGVSVYDTHVGRNLTPPGQGYEVLVDACLKQMLTADLEGVLLAVLTQGRQLSSDIL